MAGVLKPSPGALRIIDDLEGGLAIVVNGNTAPKNIAAGQYLFIKNHSTLATGGYHATAAISRGGTISSSNVTADADGIANALNSKFTSQLVTISPDSNGQFVMNIAYSTFVSMSCADASNYLCFARRSASNNCVVFSYDDGMNKITSGSYNARVWTRVP